MFLLPLLAQFVAVMAVGVGLSVPGARHAPNLRAVLAGEQIAPRVPAAMQGPAG